jgi:hypothetical protein
VKAITALPPVYGEDVEPGSVGAITVCVPELIIAAFGADIVEVEPEKARDVFALVYEDEDDEDEDEDDIDW